MRVLEPSTVGGACATRPTPGSSGRAASPSPVLVRFLPQYPDTHVEVISDSTLTDIVSERFDAGIQSGEQVAKDMIAVPIGPQMRMLLVGTPQYLASRPPIDTLQDLTGPDGINIRFLIHGGLYAWEFEKDGRELNVRMEGRQPAGRADGSTARHHLRLRPRAVRGS